MSIDQVRAQVIASIWQAVAQSGVELTAFPHDQQEKLVGKIADNMMITLNSLLDEAGGDESEPATPADAEDEYQEKVLWKGRPFLSLVEHYILTSERLKVRQGLFGRDIENFELIRIQDIDLKQGVTERIMGIGDIAIRGQDTSDKHITLRNVSQPEAVYEILRRAWLDARKRYGLQFREYM